MHTRHLSWMAIVGIAAVLTLSGCSAEAPPASPPVTGTTPSATPRASLSPPDAFVNRVWQVAESEQVAKGDLRVFLSEGTLAMASTNAKPAFGSWIFDGGRLTIVEEGQRYETDILELTADTFHIRMHSPGEPVVVRFAPADTAVAARVTPAGR